MKYRDYFSNDFETAENHYLPSLRTRYYRCHNEQAMAAVKKLSQEFKAVLKNVDNERHEIIFENSRVAVTATITSPTYSETAVDFKVTTYSLLPRGKGKKYIEDLYTRLDKLIPFKDVALYRGR
jgi:hypothetical protein